MQLKEEKMLTQVAVDDVVKGCKDGISNAIDTVKVRANQKLPLFTADILEGISNPFEGLETAWRPLFLFK